MLESWDEVALNCPQASHLSRKLTFAPKAMHLAFCGSLCLSQGAHLLGLCSQEAAAVCAMPTSVLPATH